MHRIGILLAFILFLAACAPAQSSPDGAAASTSAAAAASLAAPPSAAGLPSGWITFTAPDGSFSIGLPGQPTATSAVVDGYRVYTFQFTTADQKTSYTVVYDDSATTPILDPQSAFDDGVQGAVTSVPATLTQSHAIDLAGVPGKDYTATMEGGSLHGRMYLSGTRLYHVLAIGIPLPNVEADAFLASFTILH